MTDISRLERLAYKAELAASRKLAKHTGIALDEALRRTLEGIAGAGLEQLLVQREAQRAAAQAASAARLASRALQQEQARAARQHHHDGPASAWRAWFDGSAHPNPGRCGIGGLLTGPGGVRREIARGAGFGNSSEAEYRALIAVLQEALHLGARDLAVYGDSQGVIDDVKGQEARAAPSLRALRAEALALLAQLGEVSLRWVPRHRNAAADALSQHALGHSDRAD